MMLSYEEMMNEIPHRDIMFLLDNVTRFSDKAIGEKKILSDDPMLIEIYEKKYYPAFLFPELMAQTALFINPAKGKIPLLFGIRKYKQFSLAYPEEILKIQAISTYSSENAGEAECSITSGERLIAEGKILYCFKEVNHQ